jgi:hypothetical protein
MVLSLGGRAWVVSHMKQDHGVPNMLQMSTQWQLTCGSLLVGRAKPALSDKPGPPGCSTVCSTGCSTGCSACRPENQPALAETLVSHPCKPSTIKHTSIHPILLCALIADLRTYQPLLRQNRCSSEQIKHSNIKHPAFTCLFYSQA